MDNPKISVLLPVYNAENFLEEAIVSILEQDYLNYELIIFNDGSTDSSLSIIEKYSNQSPLIRVINRKNIGLIGTLNEGLQLAKGEYIARMDADDVALTNRFRKQFERLDNLPRAGICGCDIQYIGDTNRLARKPSTNSEMKAHLLFGSPIPHPGVMIRRSIINKYNFQYSEDFTYCEDYELWSRMSEVTEMTSVPEVLLNYRSHDGQVTEIYTDISLRNHYRVASRYLEKLDLDIPFENYMYMAGMIRGALDNLFEIDHCFKQVWNANKTKMLFDEIGLMNCIRRRYMDYIERFFGIKGYLKYRSSPFYSYSDLRNELRLFLLKAASRSLKSITN